MMGMAIDHHLMKMEDGAVLPMRHWLIKPCSCASCYWLILESQYSGDMVLLVFLDGTVLATRQQRLEDHSAICCCQKDSENYDNQPLKYCGKIFSSRPLFSLFQLLSGMSWFFKRDTKHPCTATWRPRAPNAVVCVTSPYWCIRLFPMVIQWTIWQMFNLYPNFFA